MATCPSFRSFIHLRAAARNIEQALAAPWRPDLHILDFHLDDCRSGLDAWGLLRERHVDVPTAMLTADHNGNLCQRLLDAGIGVLYKPSSRWH